MNVFTYFERVRHARDLQHDADAPAYRDITRITAEEPHAPLGWPREAEEQLYGGRFASAVRTEEGRDAAALERERHGIERRHIAIAFRGRAEFGDNAAGG